MQIQQILDEWKKDSEITMDIAEVSRRIPYLHGKYLDKLNKAKLLLKDAELRQKKLLKNKYLWYNGKLDKEEIDKNKWKYDPFDGHSKPIKTDMYIFYDSDDDIQKSEMELEEFKNLVSSLENIVTNINWRHQTITNIIRWKNFEAGN